MTQRKEANGTLDLSQLAGSPQKVKLPDSKLYSMANPADLGLLPQQRVLAGYRRAQELMGKTKATNDDVEEMVELLLDTCAVVLPSAPREVVGQLGLTSMERLIQSFLDASREVTVARNEDGDGTETTPISAS